MMRIITGRAKGTRLNTLDGVSTRPTSERAKEAVFSMLSFDIEGRDVLDLFAGSGQMGLEAASRGASSVTLVEKLPMAAAVVAANIEKTRLSDAARLVRSDVFDYIRAVSGREKYDIVFIDPPYAMHAVPDTLEALLNGDMLKRGAIVVCESEEADVFLGREVLAARFETLRLARYGAAHVTVVTPKKTEGNEENEDSDSTGEL